MIENARRLHPHCRFRVASATDLDLGEASLGGVLGWWSLFDLPRDVLPQVLALFARALKPGGHFITGTHVGDEDAVRTAALDTFLHSYNHHRCHTALGGKPPISRVNNPTGQYG